MNARSTEAAAGYVEWRAGGNTSRLRGNPEPPALFLHAAHILVLDVPTSYSDVLSPLEDHEWEQAVKVKREGYVGTLGWRVVSVVRLVAVEQLLCQKASCSSVKGTSVHLLNLKCSYRSKVWHVQALERPEFCAV